jgi:hypothetical protein
LLVLELVLLLVLELLLVFVFVLLLVLVLLFVEVLELLLLLLVCATAGARIGARSPAPLNVAARMEILSLRVISPPLLGVIDALVPGVRLPNQRRRRPRNEEEVRQPPCRDTSAARP